MYIPEELKLNKFRDCAIPSNREYFMQRGLHPTPSGEYSGDDVVPEQLNKVESMEDMQRYAELKQREYDEQHSKDE